MTISLAQNAARVSYSVSEGATQTSFTVSFEFFDDADLNVYVDGTLKTITTHYTVSGGNGSTGAVAISVTGATGGSTVVITRDIALARTTDFPTSGSFQIATLNTELDRFTAIAADLKDSVDRGLILSDFDSDVNTTLPLSNDRKGTVLGFNATTGAVEAGPKITEVQSLSDVTTSIALLGTTDAVGDMNTLAAISGNITTAAGISSNITTVAGTSANVTTVAGISGNVTTVAGIASNVSTVAGISSNITNVASNATNINSVASNNANINSVAGMSSNIATVIADASDIGTVASVSSEVNAVGDNIASVNTAAANLSSINAFSETYSIGSSDPTSNLNAGDLFYNTTTNQMKVYTGSAWVNAALTGGDYLPLNGGTMTGALGGLHRPESVTGTTPALNVGNNNFFDNGTLTATTSPTFTNVPTKSRWQYSFNSGSGGVGYQIPDTTGVGQDRAFQPIANVARPTTYASNTIYQIRFSADGDKIFFLNVSTDRIYEHALTEAWDITTIAATATTSFYYGSQESNAYDFSFSPDGMHMFLTGTSYDRLYHWTLTSSFDLTSLVYNDFKSLISNPYTHYITDDGMKLFVMTSTEYVYVYDFGSEWDASSIGSYIAAESGPLSSGDTYVDTNAAFGGFTITPDGLTLIACGNSYERITHTSLITPHVMSDVMNLSRPELSVAALNDDNANYCFGFSHNGKYMWLSGNTKKTITLFDTSSPCQVTLPSSVAEGSPTLIKPNARTTMEFVTSDGGTNVNLIKVDVV